MINKKRKQTIVLITGGSAGIGLEAAKKFIYSGAKVYITYLRDKNKNLKKLNIFKNKNLVPIKCDMRNLKQIRKLKKILKKEKKIDILVNNVGDAIRRSSFLKSDDKLWQDSININLISAVRTTHSLIDLILNSDSGVVVNISSVAARTGGGGDSLHYGTAKAAMNGFTIGLAREFKTIRVIGIAPSIVDTDFQKRHSSKKRLKNVISATPLGRIATPLEIAEIIYFISSKKASYVSGDTIYVTGGR